MLRSSDHYSHVFLFYLFFYQTQSVKGNKNEFQQQEQFGQIVDSGTFLIFQMHVLHLESVVSSILS